MRGRHRCDVPQTVSQTLISHLFHIPNSAIPYIPPDYKFTAMHMHKPKPSGSPTMITTATIKPSESPSPTESSPTESSPTESSTKNPDFPTIIAAIRSKSIRPRYSPYKSPEDADRVRSRRQACEINDFSQNDSALRLIHEVSRLQAPGTYERLSSNGVRLFPDRKDLTSWIAELKGPVGSPYEHGTFYLSIEITEGYP